MAERRMCSRKIVHSARFLKMPLSTQALYFHLLISADDDGVVEAFNIMRLAGSTEDELKLLHAKGFVKVLNDELVTYIEDWTEHNLIRADRKIDSIYKNLLLQIVPDVQLIESKPRSDVQKRSQQRAQARRANPELSDSNAINLNGGRPPDGQWADIGQTLDGLVEVSIGKDRLVEVSIVEDKIKEENNGGTSPPKRTRKRSEFIPPTLEEVIAYCEERNNNVDPKRFYDYFDTSDWYDSKGNKVKSWKQKIITWESNNGGSTYSGQKVAVGQNQSSGNIFFDILREEGKM